MQENTGIKKYVLTRQAHFGYTKQSYVGGTIITVNYDENNYTANGVVFNDLRDVNIAVRAGFLDAFSDSVKEKIDKKITKQKKIHEKLIEGKKEKLPKMEVIKSDEDLIEPIPIKSKEEVKEDNKNQKMEIISENSDDTARGMTVVRSQTNELEESSQGTVVAVIGSESSSVSTSAKSNQKTAKKKSKDSEEKALKTAEKRKADALNKRKNKKEESK